MFELHQYTFSSPDGKRKNDDDVRFEFSLWCKHKSENRMLKINPTLLIGFNFNLKNHSFLLNN